MTPESSPFSPGRPVPIEFFVGRRAEIERLRGMVRGSGQGRFAVGFVSGERGIGKSSLAAFVSHLAELDNDAVGCHVLLGGIQGLQEMLLRTFDRLLKQSIDRPWHEQVRQFFGDRIRKVGLFGVTLELNLQEGDLPIMEHDFVPSIQRLTERLQEHKKSLLLILDDINGLASSDHFANWLKSTVDEIAISDRKTRLCMIVVGLEDRRQELISRQPSLARVFDPIEIAPWSDEEVLEFYQGAFDKGRASVSDECLQLMIEYTGGLPVLAHEIGDAVWRTALGPNIAYEEAVEGIADAAEVIGRKLLEPRIFKAVRGERYRSILRKLADRQGNRFKRVEILEDLAGNDRKVLDNFLRRMKNLGVLETVPEIRGGYRFPNRLYALYFFMEAQRRLD